MDKELKEIYTQLISDVAMEISIDKDWRKRIFAIGENESLSISFEHPETIPEYVRDAIVRNRLSFLVKTVSQCPEDFDEGLVIFKFWARPFPEICSYSGNNPNIQ